MNNKKVVIALGGNAILQPGQKGTYEEQLKNIELTCLEIVSLVKIGYKVVVTHGNGPQVGNILIQNEKGSGLVPQMPLFICGAQTQGMIGFMFQQTLKRMLGKENPCEVVALITQVVVDKNDNAFTNPTKPIGPFYSKEKARLAMEEKGETWVEDSNRGWRKVVPSPEPIKIVEAGIIRSLSERGVLVIASGGGGIPVIEEDEGNYRGVEAVIDKDLAGLRMAIDVGADSFIILTDVSSVALNYGKENERWMGSISLSEAKKYMEEGHFKAGSMGPKVRACIRYVEETGNEAIITSLGNAIKAINYKAGTVIKPL